MMWRFTARELEGESHRHRATPRPNLVGFWTQYIITDPSPTHHWEKQAEALWDDLTQGFGHRHRSDGARTGATAVPRRGAPGSPSAALRSLPP